MSVNKNDLILENTRLVYYIIHKYYPHLIYDEDIVQTGMLGLCQAAEKFDEEKGKFSNYACRSILNALTLELRNRNKQKGTLSLDYVYDDDEEYTLHDITGRIDDLSTYDTPSYFDDLSDKERKVATLLYIGKTKREIAEELDCSQQNVLATIRRIKRKWRKLIED